MLSADLATDTLATMHHTEIPAPTAERFESRFALLSLAAFAWLIAIVPGGCATPSGGSELPAGVDYSERADGVPLGASTLAAAKVHPVRLRELVRAAPGEGADGEREIGAPGSRLVARLFDSMAGPSALLDGSGRDFEFEHLSTDRPFYVALSERGNRDLLARLRDGVPIAEPDALFRGSAVRLVLPAESPEALRAEIEGHCGSEAAGWMAGDCSAVARTVAVPKRGFVVVDLLYGVGDERRREYGESLGSEPPELSGYFDRMTPAVKSFVGRESAVAAYLRTADLWRASLLWKLPKWAHRLRGLEQFRRRRRFRAYLARATRSAARSMASAREFEDAAWLARGSTGGGLDAALVQTYTMRGRRAAKAGRLDTRLPTIGIEAPDVEIQWAFDTPAALRRAKIPKWMERYEEAGGANATSDWPWRTSGGAAWLSHPLGLLKHWSARPEGVPTRFHALRRLAGVRAMRAKLRVESSDEASLGFEVTGAAVAEIPRSSNLDATVEALVAIGKGAGLPVRMQTDYGGEVVRMKVTLDASMQVFGSEQPVGARTVLRARLSRLAEALGTNGAEPPGFADAPSPGALGRVELQRATNSTARAFRLRIGGNRAPGGFGLPTADVALRRPQRPPPCFTKAVEISRRALAERAFAEYEGAFEIYAGSVPRLNDAVEGCEVETSRRERLERLVAENWSVLGELHSRLRHWSSAADAFRRACERGRDAACDRQKEAQRAAMRLQLPDVGRVTSLRESLRNGVLELGQDGLRAEGERLASLEELAPEENGASPRRVVGDIEQVAGPYDYRTSNGLMYAVAMGVDTAMPIGTVEALARQVYDARVSKDDLRRVTRLADVQPSDETAQAILFLVHTHREHSSYRFGGAYYIAVHEPGESTGLQARSRMQRSSGRTRKEDLELEIEVRNTGFDIRRQRSRVEPIEGCPDDGPTVCIDDASSAESRISAYVAAQNSGDAARAREAASRVSEVFPYLRLHRLLKSIYAREQGTEARPADLDRVRLSVADELPFEVLAKTMAAVSTRSWNNDVESSAEFFADHYRTAPMFDRIEWNVAD